MKIIWPAQNVHIETPQGIDPIWYEKLKLLERFQILLASEVSGVLPVANGGTGDSGTAWTVTTPTVTASSGTFTTVSCSFRYKLLGKTAFFGALVTITTANTAAGNILFNMPFTPTTTFAGGGKEINVVGFQCNWQTNGAQMIIAKYDNTTIIGSGRAVAINGVIETT